MYSFIESNKDNIIKTLKTLISFKSVEDTPEQGAPFGIENKKALEFALSKSKELGIANCVDLDGFAGYAEAGEGEEMLAILCHLDVVPAGEGWESDPFEAVVRDGKIIGRGATDDKGPAVCAMYALAGVLASGKHFKRRVRIIFGCNEESGWGCMKHYKENAEIPTIAFSPDADYPLVNSEKGILHATFSKKFDSKLQITAGTRANVVAGKATLRAKLDEQALKNISCPLPYEIEEEDGNTTITVFGEEAHASQPENGKNAICAMLMLLNSLDMGGADGEVIAKLSEKLKMDMHGESLQLDYFDKSGRLTVNVGKLEWDKDGIKNLTFDLRCPHTKSCEENLKALLEALDGFELASTSTQDALYVDENSELVNKLLTVYKKNTGEECAKPKSIGGGTYARAFKNAVAFGCEKEGVDNRIHMANEFMYEDDILFNTRMIADAIVALACEEQEIKKTT